MKRGLLASYVAGLTDREHGESYRTMIRYFFPEFITSFLLYSMPLILDVIFISHLKSTPTYTALGTTNNFIHFLIKMAEAFSVGTMILSGQFNGVNSLRDVGRSLRDAFWSAFIVGLGAALVLYFGAATILTWYGAHEQILPIAVPFLRIRAIGVFFMFIFFALIGFMRGVKNTKTPMFLFMFGAATFILCDYLFIFGKWGMPALGLQGSAYATICQYVLMLIVAFGIILSDPLYRKYGIDLFNIFSDTTYIKQFLTVTWPVALDKATIAFAYIWLGKMIAGMGLSAQTTFCAIKDIERFSFLPAIAFAQIITFLVSNDLGKQKWQAIKSNIKKSLFLASFVIALLLIFCYTFLDTIISFFDCTKGITPVVRQIFPMVSILVFFDLLQLILSGALRGSGNVRVVMMVRLMVCICYFGPFSYILSHLPIQDETVKFMLVYGSFYIGNALMSLLYIQRFRGQDWKTHSI